ncbi:hypothetical protein DIS15_10495 [Levilactobacillus brevis]|uniref:hypothetical protein n=1 Tax=Levilactobacillus brevis TaxID=1580 RepID=UPI00111E2554|nr:hypothetical protein [Levilactobacillus brevis]TOY84378.1 hypothetical protein DIS15_10495 [Levilactobacillus brevis]
MEFKIRVVVNDKVTMFWWTKDLQCDDQKTLKLFKELIALHIPEEGAIPGGIDYCNDLTDGANVYQALLHIFPQNHILIEPSDEFLGFDPRAIY